MLNKKGCFLYINYILGVLFQICVWKESISSIKQVQNVINIRTLYLILLMVLRLIIMTCASLVQCMFIQKKIIYKLSRLIKIGRASCRERVEISMGAGDSRRRKGR